MILDNNEMILKKNYLSHNLYDVFERIQNRVRADIKISKQKMKFGKTN